MLATGAVYITGRSRVATVADLASSDVELPHPLPHPPARQTSAGPSALLLEALKDEMFQLEVEHKQGRISQQEYEQARAALDRTLERAIKRAALK